MYIYINPYMDQGIFRFHNWCSVFKVQVPCFQTVQKIVDVPQIEYEEQIVEVPVQKHVRVPMIQKVQKMVEVPQIEVEEKIVEVPVQSHVQVPMIQKVQKVVEAGVLDFRVVQTTKPLADPDVLVGSWNLRTLRKTAKFS